MYSEMTPYPKFRESPIPPACGPKFQVPPEEASEEFQSLLRPHRNNDQQGFTENEFVGIPEEADQKSRDRHTLTSFGNNGTTASINAYGQIVQISRFLGCGGSGFFCAQPWRIAVPTPFGRSSDLWDLVTVQDQFIGLQLPLRLLPPQQEPPVLRFLHNRWPRLDYTTDNYRASLQYSCHNDMVLQTYVFEPLRENSSISPQEFASNKLGIEHKFAIRDLLPVGTEFVPKNRDPADQFVKLGPHNYGLIVIMGESGEIVSSITRQDLDEAELRTRGDRQNLVTHSEFQSTRKYRPPVPDPHVGLVVTPFVNGIPQKVLRRQDGSRRYSIEFDPEQAAGLNRLEIAVLYKIQHLERSNRWEVGMMSTKDLYNMQQAPRETCFTPIRYLSDPHLNFTISRNLEHILSVCSIPGANCEQLLDENDVTSRTSRAPENSRTQRQDLSCKDSHGDEGIDEGSLVVTCGDLYGHTIDTQSSFFAFKFLLSILTFLEKEREKPSSLHQHECPREQRAEECSVCKNVETSCNLLSNRIRSTCLRHLEWVVNVGHRLDKKFPFAMKHTSPFQQFFSAAGGVPKSWANPGNSNHGLVFDAPFQILKLGEFQPPLSETNPPSCLSSKISIYVGCWLEALKKSDKRDSRAVPRFTDGGVNNFRLADHAWIWRALRCVEKLQPQSAPHCLGSARDWESGEFRRNILARFTTESPYSKKLTLDKVESKRSMLAVGRSSLENRFMFHNKDTSLFYAMDSAPGFFSTSEPNKIIDIWDATVQSQQDHEENSDSSWTKTLRYTLAIIMSQKGLRINHRTSPDMFATAMDVLLQSTSPNGLFPVLLNSNKDPIHKMDQRKSSSHLQAMFEIPYILFTYGERDHGNENDPKIQMPSDTKRDDSTISSVVPNTDSGKDEGTGHQHQERNSMQKANLKKTAPFNNLVDQKSIVDIEEEWLYNYPDFLDFTPQAPDGFKPSTYGPETGFSFVVDIPKSKRMSQAATTLPTAGQVLESLKNGGMGALVGKSRTAETAKRRFIMLSRIDREIRDLSNLISPPQESDNMESFIGRHMTFEKYFLDDTTAALNRWETELHLSYYLLFDPSKNLKTIKDERAVQFPGISKAIRQESLSFRLVGDFFNRYWTCHFVKDNQVSQEAHTKLLELLAPRHAISKSERAKEPWRQRKVLELLLFDHMLEEIIAGTSDIILETKKQVLGKDEARRIEQRRSRNADPGDEAESSALSDAVSLCKTNSIAYFAVNKQWQIFQQILEVVEDDITENLEKISEWNQREKERYLEKPRWTRNNERKYRGTISKLLASNERKILRLQRCRTNVQTLKNSLESRLQYMRDDLNAYFTTVTVIFLPLGFAAGIFSMNDDMPKAMVWHGMAFTSAAALGVTILVLVNAQKLAGTITASWNWGFRSPVAWLWQQLVNLSGWIQERTHGSYEAYNSNPSNAA